MRMCNGKLLGAFAALMVVGSIAVGADDAPPYASATEAYRQGIEAIKTGHTEAALPILAYAAEHRVLGAELKLARIYAQGLGVPKDDAKAFTYYQQIADQHAEINPGNPIAKFVAEAFVALGHDYQDGVSAMLLQPDAPRAAGLYRHAASYFGDADAQYALAHLYLTGNGVDKNVGLAANWLAMAAKKQHAPAQAALGELLWRGDTIHARPAQGLALIMLAHNNAKGAGQDQDWIEQLYRETLAAADGATRKEARALMPELGGTASGGGAATAEAPAAQASSAPSAPASSAVAAGEGNAHPPAAMGLPVGFGSGAEAIKQ
jgi:TPR repeat protein